MGILVQGLCQWYFGWGFWSKACVSGTLGGDSGPRSDLSDMTLWVGILVYSLISMTWRFGWGFWSKVYISDMTLWVEILVHGLSQLRDTLGEDSGPRPISVTWHFGWGFLFKAYLSDTLGEDSSPSPILIFCSNFLTVLPVCLHFHRAVC